MLVSAHPDDIEGAMGGTVAQLAALNAELFYLIITNGDKGCQNTDLCGNWTSAQIGYQRYQEAINAAAVFGIPAANVVELTYEDAMVTAYPEVQCAQDLVGIFDSVRCVAQIRTDMIHYIRKWKPDVMMTWYPYPDFQLQPALWGDLGFHPDHQATAAIALAARFDAGIERLFPDLGPAYRPADFYMWQFSSPTVYVNITDMLKEKINAFSQHKTQYSSLAALATELTLLSAAVAQKVNVAGVTYAEGFLPFN